MYSSKIKPLRNKKPVTQPNFVYICYARSMDLRDLSIALDRAAQSSDPSFVQASVDRATIDGWRCAIDR